MNALLANVLMVNIWGLAVNQFTALAFEDYLRGTALEGIFAIQVKYLRFFTLFFNYNIFFYALFAFMGVGVVLVILKRHFRGAKKVPQFCIHHMIERERAAGRSSSLRRAIPNLATIARIVSCMTRVTKQKAECAL